MKGTKYSDNLIYRLCPLCNTNLYKLMTKASDCNLGTTPLTFNIVKCKNCNFIYMNPAPSLGSINIYPDTYYARSSRNKFQIIKSHSTRFRDIEKLPCKNKKILDVGCGSGYDLIRLKRVGWEVYGVEQSKIAAEHAQALGINVICGDFNFVDLPNNFFDCIAMFHFIEHTYNPLEIFIKAKKLLKPNGNLIIRTPNIAGIGFTLFKSYWYDLDVPRHLNFFTPQSLTKILDKAGFRLHSLKILSRPSSFRQSLRNLNLLNQNILQLLKTRFSRFMIRSFYRYINMWRLGDAIHIVAIPTQN